MRIGLAPARPAAATGYSSRGRDTAAGVAGHPRRACRGLRGSTRWPASRVELGGTRPLTRRGAGGTGDTREGNAASVLRHRGTVLCDDVDLLREPATFTTDGSLERLAGRAELRCAAP